MVKQTYLYVKFYHEYISASSEEISPSHPFFPPEEGIPGG